MNFSYFFLLLYSRGNQHVFKDEWFALRTGWHRGWYVPWGPSPIWDVVHVFVQPSVPPRLLHFQCLHLGPESFTLSAFIPLKGWRSQIE